MAAANANWEASTTEEQGALAWILAQDGNWYLCCTCGVCGVWLEYPGFPHPCSDGRTHSTAYLTLRIIRVVETTLLELTGALECNEGNSDLEA